MAQTFNISKVMRIAGREFASTALTKGFIIGALVVPAVLVMLIPLIGILAATAKPPAVSGKILVIDRSGEVFDTLADRLSEESIRERRKQQAARAAEFAEGALGSLGSQVAGSAEAAVEAIQVPILTFEQLEPNADVEAAKSRIREQITADGDDASERILAVLEIDADVVNMSEDSEDFGAWQPFFRPKLNNEAVGEIESAVSWSVRERRFATAGFDRDEIRSLERVTQREAQEVTEQGEQKDTSGLTSMVVPVVAMVLILIATFTGGQYLLTTTIEEKSSRVVEVLLSAVSPMELMTGKIFGQMFVGLSLLVIYNAIGIFGLIFFSITGVVSLALVAYFFVYFVLAYIMFASMMAAIGSSVNDLREAQSLMTPVMLFSMVPYFFFMPVIRAPNSTLSTVMSFIPPISPFIMIMRIATPETVPGWQIAASIVVNLIAVWFLLWFAAKVFRVGLLMYGKPPNFRTLIRWVRMA